MVGGLTMECWVGLAVGPSWSRAEAICIYVDFATYDTCAGQADNFPELLQTGKLARRGQDPTSSEVDNGTFTPMYIDIYIPIEDMVV